VVKKKKCILARILKERNWSQMKLAEESGVSQSVISRYCRDASTYSVDYLFAIKEALELPSIESLFEDK
jgi:transcriptional regulator with XRE-family HTH domain